LLAAVGFKISNAAESSAVKSLAISLISKTVGAEDYLACSLPAVKSHCIIMQLAPTAAKF
jgi:hypothetical protein